MLCAFLVCALLFLVLKNEIIKKMEKGLETENYDLTIQTSNTFFAKYLIRIYILDIFRLRAYFLKKDVANFESKLDEIIHNPRLRKSEREDVMELYYHTFLIKKNEKYCTQLLAEIKATGKEKFIKPNEMAYEVVFQSRTDLIQEMEDMINSKAYSGIPLGMLTYCIALQYEALKDYEQAELNFRTSLVCFHPNSIYAKSAREHMEQLEQYL